MRAKWSAPIRRYWKISEQMIEVFNDESVKIRFTFEDVLKNYEAE